MEDQRLPDPSPNVVQLVGNAVQYLKDLHEQSGKFYDEKIKMVVESSRRERDAEAERIDKRWAVDVSALAVANERSVEQAGILATGVATSAETLRKLVAETAVTIAKQLETVTGQLIERIAALEKVQYENQGKSSAPTAVMVRLEELERLQAEGKGRSGLSTPLLMMISGAIVGVIVFLLEAAFK